MSRNLFVALVALLALVVTCGWARLSFAVIPNAFCLENAPCDACHIRSAGGQVCRINVCDADETIDFSCVWDPEGEGCPEISQIPISGCGTCQEELCGGCTTCECDTSGIASMPRYTACGSTPS
jgi:hypothetical protein